MLPSGKLVFDDADSDNSLLNTSDTDNKEESLSEDERLDRLVEKSQKILLKITTVFPFTLFPDDVIIDPQKVNIIKREFFFSERIHSVFIRDISDVFIDTSIIFAGLRIIDRGFTENSIDINFLWRDEAIKARRIIQGLVVAHRQGIEMDKIETVNLIKKLEELGKTEEDSSLI